MGGWSSPSPSQRAPASSRCERQKSRRKPDENEAVLVFGRRGERIRLDAVRRNGLGAAAPAATTETGYPAAGPADPAELQAGDRRTAQAAGRWRLVDVSPHL